MSKMMKKKWLVVLSVILLFGIAAGVFAYGSATEVSASELVTDFRYTQDIVVEEGVAKEASHTIPFTLKEDGTYEFFTE